MLRKAKEKKLRIIDATCPIVKRAQLFAKYLHRHGYDVLIVGDAKMQLLSHMFIRSQH